MTRWNTSAWIQTPTHADNIANRDNFTVLMTTASNKHEHTVL